VCTIRLLSPNEIAHRRDPFSRRGDFAIMIARVSISLAIFGFAAAMQGPTGPEVSENAEGTSGNTGRI